MCRQVLLSAHPDFASPSEDSGLSRRVSTCTGDERDTLGNDFKTMVALRDSCANLERKLAELTDNVLFADVWERPGLSKRDRSLVTVSALIALNRPDQLRSHLALARDNGVTQAELIEAITHLAFYAGWPSAVTGATVAKEVFSTK